ncbi:type I restriction-modification system subunit M [Candidatus Mycoplasma haematohominis]|uniref:site-specific DNA-methyltransferase (adenine-specific) n=1 Tax=Candidatus Mycoplasma haematohominis TaxID=1494318 RepID=A0A478FT24_9MOLU|nr:type I restriction-modification system subunit M [Candidatus Mycoplasma haemohominis]GCE63629.1 putative type I restriction enzymeP M protein [Candidatus Mycoplasma haemohominis]
MKTFQDFCKGVWDEANKLRESIDAWDFKNYFLGFMFYKYISDDFSKWVSDNEKKCGHLDFDYSKEKDENWNEEDFIVDAVKCKGTYIKPSHLFPRVYENFKNNYDNLNEELVQVFDSIAKYSYDGGISKFSGLFGEVDLGSNKLAASIIERNRKIIEIMEFWQKLNWEGVEGYEGQDKVGDLHEFLLGQFAANAGKSGGEFYTPSEVSELMVRLALVQAKDVTKVYDPACGSGSLLLKFRKVWKKQNPDSGFSDLEIFGQEVNNPTYNLCRMNMFLHGVGYNEFDIDCGDTLVNPCHRNQKFDVIVSNPPYSITWKGSDDNTLVNDPRFTCAGVLAPKSKADLAFLMHSLYHLSEKGIAVFVSFPGVLYRGGAEQKIRQYLVDYNYVDCVINLAENFFYGTSISTSILILRKSKTDSKVLFINASEQFEKVKNKNILREEHIAWIVDKYRNRENVDYVSKLVDNSEIKEQDYTLSVSTYVEKEDTREKIDIDVLNSEIERIVENTNKLRQGIKEIIGGL